MMVNGKVGLNAKAICYGFDIVTGKVVKCH